MPAQAAVHGVIPAVTQMPAPLGVELRFETLHIVLPAVGECGEVGDWSYGFLIFFTVVLSIVGCCCSCAICCLVLQVNIQGGGAYGSGG